jgi:hypothetical protein
VRAAPACLLLIVREELEGLDALAAGLGGTRRSDQRLIVLTAEPGTPSHERLRILASWNARPHAGQGAETTAAEEADA